MASVINAVFVYGGVENQTRIDLKSDCADDVIEFMLTDGNYSCDCNRSLRIRDTYPNFPEMECGDLIGLKSYSPYPTG